MWRSYDIYGRTGLSEGEREMALWLGAERENDILTHDSWKRIRPG